MNSRSSAAAQIARIAGIDESILSRSRGGLLDTLASYSVAQRLSWAANRMTTRPEDRAYSLFGLFGVNMSLLYGEGNAAFSRLQEEILNATGDLSILAWPRDSENGLTPLAGSVGNFSSRKVVVKARTQYNKASQLDDSDTSVLTGGLRVRAPVVMAPLKDGYPGLAMLLGCRHESDITTVLALKLSVTSGTSVSNVHETLRHQRLDCSVGWTTEPGQDRLVALDALHAASTTEMKTIFIRRDRVQGSNHPSAKLSRPRGWTRLWLRFDDSLVGRGREVLDIYPKQYWNRSNRNFDLVKAREDNVRKDESALAGVRTSTFGLPVFGAIAISNKSGDRVSVFFCQHGPSADDGIAFDVMPYDEKAFQA